MTSYHPSVCQLAEAAKEEGGADDGADDDGAVIEEEKTKEQIRREKNRLRRAEKVLVHLAKQPEPM